MVCSLQPSFNVLLDVARLPSATRRENAYLGLTVTFTDQKQNFMIGEP